MNWISIKEKLPELNDDKATQVIVNSYVKGAREENVQICAVFHRGKFYLLEWWQATDHDDIEEIILENVNYWMPIPDYPLSNS